MNKSKKIMCLVLAVATVVPMMFSGCNKTTNAAGGKPGKTVTLEIYSGDKVIQGIDRVSKAVNEYLAKKNTGLAIKWEAMSWDNLGAKEATMLSTGQKADVMNCSSWLQGCSYISNAQNGYFADLTKYIQDPANADLVKLIDQKFLDGTKINGKYYGLPTNKEKAHNFGFLVLDEEVKKLGIDTKSIKTMDDMEKYFDKAKADKLTPICAAKMDNPFKFLDWDTVDSDGQVGAFDPNEGKTVVDQFTAPKTVDFYKKMKEYNKKGYFSANAATVDSQETEMKTNKYFCGSWSLMPGKSDTESSSLGIKLDQIDITPYEKTNRETLGALCIIPAASDHKDEAFKFIKMLYTDKTLINLMTYGVEGTDYTKKSDKVIELKKNSDFKTAGGWIWGNQFNNYLTTDQKPTYFDDMQAYNQKAKPLESLGFLFDSKNVKTEYANCQNVIKTYYPRLFYGTCSDVDATVAELKSKLKEAGEEKLIKEMQTQFDTFKSGK